MDSAKNAVKGILSRHGKADTDVSTTTAPAVTDETITKTNEERVTTAVDREIHQDHHHTTVQPVQDRAVKAEQHHHNVAATQERRFDHDDSARVQERLESDRSHFRDTTRTVDGGSTVAAPSTVAGEHVHHHVHEHIQPVIQRETIEPHITHTTVPVHEVHHNATKVHDTSTLPAVTLEEFTKKGGSLAGNKEHLNSFEGEPRLNQNTRRD